MLKNKNLYFLEHHKTTNKLKYNIMIQCKESILMTQQIKDFCLSQKIVKCNFNIDNLTFENNQTILIEPETKNKKFNGMMINYFKHTSEIFGVYEVAEYQAGKNKNELHIFSNHDNLKDAIKCLSKGNKRDKKDILKIYK